MNLQLDNKIALVTGSTAGIGFSIARTLAAEGAAVVLNGRTRQRVDDAVAAIAKELPAANVRGIAADLGTADGASALVSQLPRVDILVNNLGIFEPKPFEEIPDADWLRLFEVNVLSGVRLSRAYFPQMLASNWGRVIFIASESAYMIPAEMIHYGMTKSAQVAVARGLAERTAGTDVTVNSVLPGPTHSEGVEVFVNKLSGGDVASFEKDFFEKMRPTSLIRRFATTDEVAAVVAFICSPLAATVNGAAVRAEGGLIRSAF